MNDFTSTRRVVIMMSIVATCLFVLESFSQPIASQPKLTPNDVQKSVTKNLKRFTSLYPNARIEFDDTTGLPNRVFQLYPKKSNPQVATNPQKIVEQFFSKREVRSVLFYQSSALNALGPESSNQQHIAVMGSQPDPNFPQNSIVLVQQKIGDVPVFGAEAKVQVNPSIGVVSLNSSFVPTDVINTTPSLDATQAAQKAVEYYHSIIAGARDSIKSTEAAMVGESPKPSAPVLYVIDPQKINSSAPSGLRLSWQVHIGSFIMFIDARTGELLHRYRDVYSEIPRKAYDFQSGTSQGTLVLDEGGPIITPVPADAQSAFANVGATMIYFRDVQHRQSLGPSLCDAGIQEPIELRLNVRYGTMKNAYWHPQLLQMFFGDHYASDLDVVGHEVTHGFTQFLSCLMYSAESGAVNESMSDFFGQMINGHNGVKTWMIGATLPDFTPPARPLRDMKDPHNGAFDKSLDYSATNRGQPDHYSELVHENDPICNSTDDYLNGCVHFNSGILNKAEYLIAEGGTHHGVAVKGIGREKSELIVYRALAAHLRKTAGLKEAAADLISSCLELKSFPSFGIGEQDCDSVTTAVKAVGLQ
jgi:Zn-dependent metalloprotease